MPQPDVAPKGQKLRMISSLRFKIALAFAVMLIAALGFINYYPVQIVRQQIIKSAELDMRTSAITLAGGIASLSSELKTEDIQGAVAFFEPSLRHRVLVSNAYGIILFDSAKSKDITGKMAVFPEIFDALGGWDNFSCTFTDNSFENRAAAPIIRDGNILGSVFLVSHDAESARLIEQMRLDNYRVSVLGLVLFIFIALFFNIYLSQRFSRLLGGISAVGRGDYDYRIDLSGKDELAGIADEFNELSFKLKTTDEVRRQFVSDASHELKTPLASIKLLSDSIEQNANVSEGDMREFVHDIGEEIQRLIRISEDLISLTRLDSTPKHKISRCRLSPTVKKCAELLRGSAEFFEVSIKLSLNDDLYVLASEDGLFHIIFNLMENAIKYNRPGGHLNVLVLESGEDYAQLVIEDNGIGIPKNELEHIFDRFYRVDKTRARDTGGSGLGLSIAKEWVDTMGGRIEIESHLGKGTIFHVFLPKDKGGAK